MSKEIAQTILNQLGGNKFAALTGAKHFSFGKNCLVFSLPNNFAKNKINHVSVTLDSNDTYTITFKKTLTPKTIYNNLMAGKGQASCEAKIIASESEVYCDNLQAIFKEHTGLFTEL